MKKMCIIGSLNIDIVFSATKFPEVGESVFANTFDIYKGGGKGANQACALGKLGADVMLVGKVGDLFYGPDYIKVLENNGVQCNAVSVETGIYPGIGIVGVNEDGDNIIFVYPGANDMVDIDCLNKHWDYIKECDIFLFQLEIPVETNLYAMKKLMGQEKTIIFDPAPVKEFPLELYQYVDYITPNKTELQSLSGITIKKEADYKEAAHVLLRKGVSTVIAKAGKKGAYFVDKDSFIHISEIDGIKAIDPTAAGDSFNAGFAYYLSRGMDVVESIKFANAVAGLSTTAMGAQNAMPSFEEVNNYLSSIKNDT